VRHENAVNEANELRHEGAVNEANELRHVIGVNEASVPRHESGASEANVPRHVIAATEVGAPSRRNSPTRNLPSGARVRNVAAVRSGGPGAIIAAKTAQSVVPAATAARVEAGAVGARSLSRIALQAPPLAFSD